ncbi:MAG: L-serine ammonia-lyase, iron-sulfur-dependent, subunit alpha [Myxococcota bacterium]
MRISEMIEPVMGCTEPAAMAMAASVAARVACGAPPAWLGCDGLKGPAPKGWPGRGDIELVDLRTTRNLFKNAMAVGLPNTGGRSGISLAAALGVYLDPASRLNLLKQTTPETLAMAGELLGSGRVTIGVDERDVEVFIECRVIARAGGERHVGEVIVRGCHDAVAEARRDGAKVFQACAGPVAGTTGTALPPGKATLEGLVALARQISDEDRALIIRGARMNMEAARVGLEKGLGLGVGAALGAMVRDGILGDGPVSRARVMTAAACDARMSGYEIEIMASGGSGNQGIMATISPMVLGGHMKTDERRLVEAMALGHIITSFMTGEAGLLGGMCGCAIKAGIGATAACAYIFSDDPVVLEGAVNNMAGNIAGEICDGAKVGCALKLATAAGTAVEAAVLAARGVSVPSTNGIIGRNALDTLDNIGALARTMHAVDMRIVEIMRAKA